MNSLAQTATEKGQGYDLNFAPCLRHLRLRLKSLAEMYKSSEDDYHPTDRRRIHAAFTS